MILGTPAVFLRLAATAGAVLLFALAGCAESEPAAVIASPQGKAAGSARAGKLAFEGHHPSEVLNPFPVFVGPVPQERGQDHRPPQEPPAHNMATTPVVPSGTLVLYDRSGAYGWLGELYATAGVTLANHFGAATAKPVANYQVGDLAKYKAVLYIGSTYDEPLPVGFLDDVLKNTTTEVLWMYNNIWQLANRAPNFAGTYGFNPWIYDTAPVASVTYKGVVLSRETINGAGIMSYSSFDATKAKVLATATKTTGGTLPWAVRSAKLTYFGEIPFAYIASNDRYLAFCDLLFDALAPTTAVRHRALVRLEDVSPDEDPVVFRAIVDYLYGAKVPFSVAVIPMYTDPRGYYNGGKAMSVRWKDRPQMLAALKYATTRGGTLVLHGFTHQFSNLLNPYSGVSADDFEFFAAHVDAKNSVIYDGAVPGDSATWAVARVNSGIAELTAAGIATPAIFEFPHYAGSPTDAKAIRSKFATVYHRGLYFSGALGANPENLSRSIGLFYPYTVKDVYGYKVLPENLGNYEDEGYNNHPPRLAADLITTAKKNLVVRDGVASFFFHPYFPLSELKAIVTGVKAAGYTFVAPQAM
jgi:uncharacterized protein YdaL